MKFSEKLQNLRKTEKISQEDLANMLDVSRQAVSKWESGTTYPEMDKLINLSKIFKCSLDDLTNDDVKDININQKKKNNVNNLIDEILDLIKKTIKMFKIMNYKEITTCILTMILVGLVLLLLNIPFNYLNHLGYDIFINFGLKISNILSSIWNFFLGILYFIIFIVVFVYIYKIKYLDVYEDKQLIIEEEKNDNKNNVKEQRVKKESSVFFNILGIITMWIIKIFIFFISLPILLTLLCVIALFIIVFILLFKGVFYFGVLLGLLSLGILLLWLIALMFYFLFNKKINIKLSFLIFIISIIVFGISLGIFSLEIANTSYINNVFNEKVKVNKEELEFLPNMIIEDVFEYIIDEELTDKVLIEFTYYDNYIKPYIEFNIINNFYINRIDNEQLSSNKKIIKLIINDLKKKQIHNYNLLYDYKIKVYTSYKNIETLKENYVKFKKIEDTIRKQEEKESYEKQLNNCYQEQDKYQKENDKNNIKIEQLKDENEELQEKLKEYKNKIRDLIE